MRVRLFRYALALVALSLSAIVAVPNAFSAEVTPKTVNVNLNPGQSTTVAKSVETTKLPPDSDFVFLADNTGSMQPSIDDVKANAQSIIDAIEASGATNARYGVANYQDTTRNFACPYLFQLNTDLTTAAAAKAAINTSAAGDGCDIDPKPDSTDYPPPCAASEQGNAGQALRITTATGGVDAVNPPASTISQTIINAINALPPIPVVVTPVANCDAKPVMRALHARHARASLSFRTAARITSTGAGIPVHRSNDAAPCARRTSRPSTTRAPASSAARAVAVRGYGRSMSVCPGRSSTRTSPRADVALTTRSTSATSGGHVLRRENRLASGRASAKATAAPPSPRIAPRSNSSPSSTAASVDVPSSFPSCAKSVFT